MVLVLVVVVLLLLLLMVLLLQLPALAQLGRVLPSRLLQMQLLLLPPPPPPLLVVVVLLALMPVLVHPRHQMARCASPLSHADSLAAGACLRGRSC